MTRTDPIHELVRIAGRLVAVMNQETELLRNHQATEIAALQDEKSQLALAYATLTRTIRAEPETLRALTKALRDELRDTIRMFEQTARANARAIEAARAANERVIQAIVAAASAVRQPTASGYSPTGGRVLPRRPDLAAPVSVAINRQL